MRLAFPAVVPLTTSSHLSAGPLLSVWVVVLLGAAVVLLEVALAEAVGIITVLPTVMLVTGATAVVVVMLLVVVVVVLVLVPVVLLVTVVSVVVVVLLVVVV